MALKTHEMRAVFKESDCSIRRIFFSVGSIMPKNLNQRFSKQTHEYTKDGSLN